MFRLCQNFDGCIFMGGKWLCDIQCAFTYVPQYYMVLSRKHKSCCHTLKSVMIMLNLSFYFWNIQQIELYCPTDVANRELALIVFPH